MFGAEGLKQGEQQGPNFDYDFFFGRGGPQTHGHFKFTFDMFDDMLFSQDEDPFFSDFFSRGSHHRDERRPGNKMIVRIIFNI